MTPATTQEWHPRAICTKCGWHTYAPFSSLFHARMEMCPECGEPKSERSWLIEAMKWEPPYIKPKWYKPSTWRFSGTWLIKIGQDIHLFKGYAQDHNFLNYVTDEIKLCGFCRHMVGKNNLCTKYKQSVQLHSTACKYYELSQLFFDRPIYMYPKQPRKLMVVND